jgi:hypothetical protein
MTNKRRNDRISIRLKTYGSFGRVELVGVLTNISYSGTLTEYTTIQPAIGTPIVLHVHLKPPSAFEVATPFDLEGRVVRHSPTGFAIVHEDNLDPDVRRMVDDAAEVVAIPR